MSEEVLQVVCGLPTLCTGAGLCSLQPALCFSRNFYFDTLHCGGVGETELAWINRSLNSCPKMSRSESTERELA